MIDVDVIGGPFDASAIFDMNEVGDMVGYAVVPPPSTDTHA